MAPAADMTKSGKAFVAGVDFIRKLRNLSYALNAAMQQIDPVHYALLEKLRAKIRETLPWTAIFDSVDPSLLDSREVLYNKCTEEHNDKQDPQLGWAVLVLLGQFSRGRLFVPKLNLYVRANAGDAIWIRGRVLRHSIEEFDGPQRLCIPHFIHSSVWEQFDMGDDVSI